MNSDFDVIIVGAGPAGATCGKILSDAGKRILIIDKRKLPRIKCCSGLLSPRGLGLVNNLFGPVPEKVICRERFLDLVVVTDKEKTIEKDWLHVNRQLFDYWLISQSKIEVWDKTRYISHCESENQVKVMINQSGIKSELKCKYLIAADGGYSRIRRSLQKTYRISRHVACVQKVFHAEPGVNFMPKNHYYFLDEKGVFSDLYGWLFKQDNFFYAGVTYYFHNRKKDYMEQFIRFLEQNDYIRIHKLERIESCLVNAISKKPCNFGMGRVFFAGESTSLVTQIAEGIPSALKSSLELSNSILHSPDDPEKILENYKKNIKEEEIFVKQKNYF